MLFLKKKRNREEKENKNYRINTSILWQYIPIGKHVLLREIENLNDWEQNNNGLLIKKASAREGLFFRGLVIMTGELVERFKEGDLVLYNTVEGFRFTQIINGQLFYFRIINQNYIIPATFKKEELNL